MDFEQLLSAFQSKTCVMSVEAFPDGHYGNIRIVAGNQAHCDDMLQTMHRPFVPGSPYEAYFPQDKNFEDFCCRCARTGRTSATVCIPMTSRLSRTQSSGRAFPPIPPPRCCRPA